MTRELRYWHTAGRRLSPPVDHTGLKHMNPEILKYLRERGILDDDNATVQTF